MVLGVRRGWFPLLVFLLAVFPAPAGLSYDRPHELVDRAYITLRGFLQGEEMVWLREHLPQARAVIVVPQLLKGAFFIGGSGGSGVLLARHEDGDWSYPAFYTLGSVSVGLQIGGEAAEVVLLVMSQRGVDALLSTAVKLGGDLSVAAGPVGVGAKAQIADVVAFSRTRGAFIGLSVEGAVLRPKDSWNRLYYRKPDVRPVDIIYGKRVRNPHADPLRRLLSTCGRAGKPAGGEEKR